jgi:alkylation response protein AidB-like acyl-CoA dehydrogenase
VDFRFTAEEESFRDEVQTWFGEHLVGEYRQHLGVVSATDPTAWELRRAWERELAAARLLNITWPEEYGGRGGTLNQEVIFLMEFARVRAPYWVGVHGRDLFGPTLLRHGTPEQKARFLPKITHVEEMWGQGFSEPDAGSDLAGLQTRAVLDGEDWVVNGQKIWMTFGMYADWLYTLCRTNPDEPKHRGISLLMIPVDQPGIDIRPIRNIAGGQEFCEVFLTDARTPSDLVVGPLHGGWGVAMGTLGTERVMTTLPMQFGFDEEMDDLLAVVRARGVGSDPVVRQRLSRAWIGLQINRYNNYRALTAIMRGGELGAESSITKLFWANWHRDFGELMVDLLGPDAMLAGEGGDVDGPYSLGKFQSIFVNARAETIYGGANEIQRNILGERVLGLPKEP